MNGIGFGGSKQVRTTKWCGEVDEEDGALKAPNNSIGFCGIMREGICQVTCRMRWH